jgi:hypothetical protein
MIYFLALIPATILVVAGYVALYLAQRSEGNFQSFGKYLGFWAICLSMLVILWAVFAAALGVRHDDMMREHSQHGMMMHGRDGGPRNWGHGFGEAPDNWQPGEAPGAGSSGAQPPASGTAQPSMPPSTTVTPPH